MLIQPKTLPDGTHFEQACVVVRTIHVGLEDMEHYDQNGVVEFVSVPKCSAIVYVWCDEVAYKHRAAPSHWYRIEFECDLNKNIFEQAYEKLKENE